MFNRNRSQPAPTAGRPAPAVGASPARKRRWWQFRDFKNERARFVATLAVGVAATVIAGYLAALIVFPTPNSRSERDVPRVIGLGAADAAHELRKHGLTDSVESHETHPTAAPGTVIWQDPAPGTALPRGSAVILILSGGPPMVTIPDVHGFDGDMAQKLLLAAGLHVDAVDSVDLKTVPTGFAAGTTPAGGGRLTSGHTVTLHLAR
jgi:beta-lactam-binding protein with PASTA domain